MSSALRSGFPIIFTSFVDKSGSIGMSLLPMIMVEKQLSVGQSSLVMGFVRGTLFLGTLLGGWGSDRVGARRIYLASFGLPAIGFLALAFADSVATVAAAAMVAQLGKAFFSSTARLILRDLVERRLHQEAFGWLRTGNNLGQIVSYSVGAALSTLGIPLLLVFDATTSFVAFLLGLKWIPDSSRRPDPWKKDDGGGGKDSGEDARAGANLFVIYSFVVFGMTFIYELFMVGAAAKFKLVYADDGLRVFSLMMILNTVLCTLFAVPASRRIKDPGKAMPLGFLLTAIGSATAMHAPERSQLIYLGMLILTAGEIVFSALSQFLLLRMTPAGSSQGTLYSGAMSLQVAARVLAGVLAFPLVVYSDQASAVFLLSAVPFIILVFWIRKRLRRFAS